MTKPLPTIETGRKFVSLREAMDDLFAGSFVPALFDGDHDRTIAVDLYERPDAFVISAVVPGLKQEDLKIETTSDRITLSGEIRTAETSEEGAFLRKERTYGRFERSFMLPLDIDRDKVEATLDAGVLTIVLPKAEQTKSRKVPITVKAR